MVTLVFWGNPERIKYTNTEWQYQVDFLFFWTAWNLFPLRYMQNFYHQGNSKSYLHYKTHKKVDSQSKNPCSHLSMSLPNYLPCVQLPIHHKGFLGPHCCCSKQSHFQRRHEVRHLKSFSWHVLCSTVMEIADTLAQFHGHRKLQNKGLNAPFPRGMKFRIHICQVLALGGHLLDTLQSWTFTGSF